MGIRYYKNGQEVTREQCLENGNDEFLKVPFQASLTTYREHDPLISDGLGCMKSQVPEMREMLRHRNIRGITVRDSGQLEITSREGRRDLNRARQMFDRDGGYGD